MRNTTKIMILSLVAGMLFPSMSNIAAADSGNNPPNWGQRKSVTWDALKDNFQSPDMIYAPFMFWFWDEPLNTEKMAEMSRVMCSEGFNPGYAHARRSMVGTPSLPAEEWLSDIWYDAFGSALQAAEKEKAYLGYCDEYWWPSFQACGRVLNRHPELKPVSLNFQTIDVNGGTEVAVPASFFAVAAEMFNPDGKKLPKIPQLGHWIWHPNGQFNTHRCWFRKRFEVPEDKTIDNAQILITADNAFVLYVNGKRVGESDDWTEVSMFDLKEVLLPGENVIAIEAKNIDAGFGLIAGVAGEYRDGTDFEFRSDKSWLSSLSPTEGWERVNYDMTNWTSANEIANNGGGPWSSLSNLGRPATIYSKTLQIIGSGDAFTWKVPSKGIWRIYAFNQYSASGEDGGWVNSIDDRLADAFIEISLEPYAQRMGDKLGKSIPGDFVDHEGDYGRKLAWSESLDQQYKKRYGRDIRLWLPLMINKDAEGIYAKARWEWFDLVSDLYCGNFQTVTDWHEKRGMYTTGHVWEESLNAQASVVGDHMKLLRSFTMPGQDCLGRKALRVHDFKECSSVAEFENVRAMTELMGAGGFEGTPWGTFTPVFLKQAANAVTAWGMSHVIPHGVFTTRKLSGNPWPPDWYDESPMYPLMDIWTDFVRRASYINSMGCAAPDVLLYNPLESAWINSDTSFLGIDIWHMQKGNPASERIHTIDSVYSGAIDDLTEARIEFLVGDRYYLNQMVIKKGKLVRGDFSFSAVVLPPLDILTLASARKIVDFAKAGGRVYALGELPTASAEHGMDDPVMMGLMETLKKQPSYLACFEGLKAMLNEDASGLKSPVTFMSGEFKMLQHRRRIAGKDFFWLVNNSEQKQDCEVLVNGVKGYASIWDCETGEIRPVISADSREGSRLKLHFKPLEAYWLVFDSKRSANKAVPTKPELKDVLTVTGLWKVTYDGGIQPTMEFPLTPPSEFVMGVEKPLEDWNVWATDKFSGLMDYTKTVYVDKTENRMLLDLGKVCYAAEVWVNGKPVGARLWGPYVFDISQAVHPGNNEIHVRVANLINNSYGEIKESGLFGPVSIQMGQFSFGTEK